MAHNRWQWIKISYLLLITGNFTCLAVVFNLRRRLGYHLFHTYIPSALIVVMSWISFWIKPEAIPARVTLGVTSLLTLGNMHLSTYITIYLCLLLNICDHWSSPSLLFLNCKLCYYYFFFQILIARINTRVSDLGKKLRFLVPI